MAVAMLDLLSLVNSVLEINSYCVLCAGASIEDRNRNIWYLPVKLSFVLLH